MTLLFTVIVIWLSLAVLVLALARAAKAGDLAELARARPVAAAQTSPAVERPEARAAPAEGRWVDAA